MANSSSWRWNAGEREQVFHGPCSLALGSACTTLLYKGITVKSLNNLKHSNLVFN
jgi:hypothetical protein